jgi:quinolinate synthase
MINAKETLQILAEEIYDSSRKSAKYEFSQCMEMAVEIQAIRELKKEKDVALFAHSYVNAEILEFVADVVGDSLHLAEQAKLMPQKNYIFSAVQFMAETAKILSPEKKVYLSAEDGGCSLAESITGAEIVKLRAQFPTATFVCYVNTTAEVKAFSDVSVTSTNALKVLANIPNNEIYFLPDKFMGENLARALKAIAPEKTMHYYHGTCVVHEKFTPEEVTFWKSKEPGLMVLAHPECKPEVASLADFVGSTSKISQQILSSDKEVFLALTECGLSTHLQWKGLGSKRIVGSCSLCPYMKSNSLKSIRRVLNNLGPEYEVDVAEQIRDRALLSLNRMWELSKN